jgi:hypothetical protein
LELAQGEASSPLLPVFLTYQHLLAHTQQPLHPRVVVCQGKAQGSSFPVTQGCFPCLLAPQVKALGYDGVSPTSVPSWLDSLGLQDYVHSFLSSGYSSIDTVKNLWELELVNVSVPGRPGALSRPTPPTDCSSAPL